PGASSARRRLDAARSYSVRRDPGSGLPPCGACTLVSARWTDQAVNSSAKLGNRKGGEAGRPASPDDDLLSGRRCGYAAQAVLAPVLKDQSDGVAQTVQSGRLRLALAIRAGNLWAIRDVPTSIPFHYRGELVSHARILLPPFQGPTSPWPMMRGTFPSK